MRLFLGAEPASIAINAANPVLSGRLVSRRPRGIGFEEALRSALQVARLKPVIALPDQEEKPSKM